MAININNYNDVFAKLTTAVDAASLSNNDELKKIFNTCLFYICRKVMINHFFKLLIN